VPLQVYVIGETGILEELDLKGIQHLGGPDDADKVVTLKKGEFMEHDPEVRAGGGGGGSLQQGCLVAQSVMWLSQAVHHC
jgi:hypothetical protein